MEAFSDWLVDLIDQLGYLGIFLSTLIESTFVPIPAEVTMIPAGMLVAEGRMDYWITLLFATLGVIAGSAINYWFGYRYGRKLILRFGKYIFIKPRHIEKTENFFTRYGAVAVFMGRLLPGVRHYIAFVAGIGAMKPRPFLIYTSMGGLIWMWVLLQVGYMSQRNAENPESHVGGLEMAVILVVVVSALAFGVQRILMRRR